MEELVEFFTLDITDNSTTPKYRQIAKSIATKVYRGVIEPGQKLPSINQLSAYYLLSRDTIEKAYAELKKSQIIVSSRGLGYFISNKLPDQKLKILVLFNKLSAYKKEIYNSLAHELEDIASLSLRIYHCDFKLFENIILENSEDYHYYIIMPHFLEYQPSHLIKSLNNISRDKLIVLDYVPEGLGECFSSIYQDFVEDIYTALTEAKTTLKKYTRLNLIFPDNNTYPYPKEIVTGFVKFCQTNQLPFSILSSIDQVEKVNGGEAYIIISESELTKFIKKTRAEGLVVGADVGVISYNDTELKEVLENGITVISTDFKEMGKLAAKSILNSERIHQKNNFGLILRNSL
jgi:DNA-binding GntR family transcriptional regulator